MVLYSFFEHEICLSSVLFAELAVRNHCLKPTHMCSHCSAPFPLPQSISFLSTVSSMLLVLCSILTIALSFQSVENATSFEQDDVMKRVLVSGDLI